MKDIKGYEGIYKITENGEVFSVRNNRFLKLNQKKNGYVYIELNVNGINKWHRLHRLVAETYLENPKSKPFVNHKDGNKANNQVSNLEWVTASENNLHAYKNGLSQKPCFEYLVYDRGMNLIVKCVGQDEVLKVTGIKAKQTVKIASESGNLTRSGHYIKLKGTCND